MVKVLHTYVKVIDGPRLLILCSPLEVLLSHLCVRVPGVPSCLLLLLLHLLGLYI